MNSNWTYKHNIANVHEIKTTLQNERKIDSNLEFYPSELLPDFDVAKNIVIEAIANSSKILIYGDYDADGITATTILNKFLSYHSANVSFKIPDRFTDGYGLNMKHAEEIVANKLADVVITVDNGITAHEPVQYLKDNGIKVVITDHHTCIDSLPNADAVVNCHRNDSIYPFSDLCGAALAYKFAVGLNDCLDKKYPGFPELLDLAAVATISDVVPLVDENRHIVDSSLGHLCNTTSNGLSAIIKCSDSLRNKANITSEDVAFSITPLINASSRMGNIGLALDLFKAESLDDAMNLARNLVELNESRKALEVKMTAEAMKIIAEQGLYNELAPIVVYKEDWHLGIIGITAAKLAEKYQCPVFIGSAHDGVIHGSARSYGDFNIVSALTNSSSVLKTFGGHPGAGGFSLDVANIQAFKESLCCYSYENPWSYDNNKLADALIPIDDIDCDLINEIYELAPFGEANPIPVFISENVQITSIASIGKDGNTLKMTVVGPSGHNLNCIGFSMPEYPLFLSTGDTISIVYKLSINTYAGRTSPQAMLIDIISDKINANTLNSDMWDKEYQNHLYIINKDYANCKFIADNPSDNDYKNFFPFICKFSEKLLAKNNGISVVSLVCALKNEAEGLPTVSKVMRMVEIINETKTLNTTVTLGGMIYFSRPDESVEKIRITNTELYKNIHIQ